MDFHRRRSTEEARKALSSFCKAVGTAGDHSVHIFTAPVDQERDADFILSDVITERDLLQKAMEEIVCMQHMHEGNGGCHGPCPICAASSALGLHKYLYNVGDKEKVAALKKSHGYEE